MIDNDLFKKLFDKHSAIIYFIDISNGGIIIYSNKAAQELTGYSEDEFLKLKLYELSIDNREAIDDSIKQLLNDENKTFEFTHKKSGGELRKVIVHSSPINLEGRTLIFSITMDVTEKIYYQEMLKISEQRLNLALENAGDGVWDWNLETNEVFFSKQWKNMLGFSESEISNDLLEWSKRVHPDDLENVKKIIEDYISGKTAFYQTEHRVLCKDGNYKWILDRGKITEYKDGKPLRIIGTHSDLTEIKNKEKELIGSNSRKDTIMSIVSHDLRGPIGAFNELINFMIENFNKFKIEEINQTIIEIKKSTSSLYDLMDNLLNWARLNKNKDYLNFEIIKIKEVMKKAEENMYDILKTKKIKLINKISEEITINTDRETFIIVIRNLISNAVKFSYPDGIVEIFAEKKNDNIEIIVKDYGVGMSEETLDNLNNNTLRVSSFGTNQEKGSGLGLNLCNEMLKLINGKMEIESKIGEGSTIKLIF